MAKFPLPNAALENHLAVVGKTGSGKTSTSKLIVEHVVSQDYRVCILDPIKSDWWGITSSANGKHPGLPFNILGGPHGHVPLHPLSGNAIGQLVGSGKLPLSILDMADFGHGDLQKFFIDFAKSMMRNTKGIVYLVVEEAHEFAPKELGGFGAENMALHYAKKLATAGRSKGIRLIVATQRVQSLHNAVLGSCETLVAQRLTTPADQDPILKWLKVNTDKETQLKVAQSLSSLPTGTGWVCSGELQIFEQVKFPKFNTYDNTVTPTKDGSTKNVKIETSQVDREQLRAILGDAIKDVEANDPRALKAEIAKLRKEAIEAGKLRDPIDLDAVREKALNEGYKDGEKIGYVEGFNSAVNRAKAAIDTLPLLPSVNPALKVEPLPNSTRLVEQKVEGRSIAPNKAAPPRKEANSFVGAPAKLLAIIDTNPPMRRSWKQIATLAGLKARGGHFNSARKTLLDSGLLRVNGNMIEIMNPSGDAMPSYVDRGDLVDMWCKSLSGAAPKILRFISNNEFKTKEQIAEELGMQPRGGHWNAAWKELRDNELVQSDNGTFALAEIFNG